MRIGIDAREIQNGVITGIGRSIANFIEFFRKNEKKHTLTIFSEKKGIGLQNQFPDQAISAYMQ